MFRLAAVLVAAFVHLPGAAADLAVCPGEGDRYGDHKCNHDVTHRFCAQLLGSDGQPKSWGPKGNFWQITGQTAFQWDDEIRANSGDSWCICMWAAASLIEAVGCENVHLHCEATDIAYIEKQYSDAGQDLSAAKACLEQKCPGASIMQEDDATVPRLAGSESAADGMGSRLDSTFVAPLALVSSLAMAGMLAWRMRGAVASRQESLLAEGTVE